MNEITPQELKKRLDGNDRPLLLDVRQDWETRLCKLTNAVHIPIEEIELRTDELNAADEIVVYCHQGVRSAAVADYLRQLEAGAEARPVHGGDHRKRRLVHRGDRIVERGDQLSPATGVELAENPDVHAGRERAAVADDGRQAHRVVRGQRLERVAQRADEGGLEQVQRRAVERAPDRPARATDRERRRH